MAANTGIVHGGDIMLFINTGTEGSPTWTANSHATSHSITHTMSPREVSSKDTGAATSLKPGKIGVSTISIEALRCYDGYSYFDLLEKFQARERIGFKYSGRASGTEIDVSEQTGDNYEKGYGYITSLNSNDPHDNNATISCTISIDGLTTIEVKA